MATKQPTASAVWSSDHPDVLAWWADNNKRNRAYFRLIKKVERETGRKIFISTGFGDDYVIGLSSHSYDEEPPPGWKLGYGERGKGFFEPRATPRKGVETKADCEAAQKIIRDLNDKRPKPRSECHEKFGTPTHEFFGFHAISPGFELLDGRLWIVFGDHEYQPRAGSVMPQFFTPEKLSAYHAAKEKEEAA